MALMAGAPHPYAAMLFIDFLLSVDGQQALAEAGFAPTRKGSQPIPEYRWFAPSVTGKKEIMLPTQQENAMYEKSTAIYNDMFR